MESQFLFKIVLLKEGEGFLMTEKELGKLNRRQLLEMLLEQTKRAQELENELQEKNRQLAEKDALLSERSVTLDKAGTIADAALSISRVFESAQTAADIYLKNVEAHSKRGEELLENAKKRSEEMLAETKRRCAAIEKQTAERIKAFKAEVGKLSFDDVKQPSE